MTEATGQTTLARLAGLYTGTVATAASSVTLETVYHHLGEHTNVLFDSVMAESFNTQHTPG